MGRPVEGKVRLEAVGDREPWRPGHVLADIDRLGADGQRGELGRDTLVRQVLPPIAADRHRSPAVPLGEVRRADDLLGRGQRVDGVAALDETAAGVVEAQIERGGEIEVLPVIPADVGGPAPAALEGAAVSDGPAEKAIEDPVLAGGAVLDVPVGVPVELGGRIEIVVGGPVVADVGDLTVVPGILPDDVVEPEARDQDPRAAPGARILEDERQPQHRHVPDVEGGRPRHHHGLRDPLDLARREVIVRGRQIAAGDLALGSVQPGGTGVLGQVAPEEPVGAALLEAGQRVGHDPPPDAGVVADAAESGEHRLPVEQRRVADRRG